LLSPPTFPRKRNFILAPKRILSRFVIFPVVPADHLTVRTKVMVEPLDREVSAFRLITECFAQELDESHTLFNRLLAVPVLADLRAIFVARCRSNADVVLHKSPRSEKLKNRSWPKIM
jgi:hypothetical protein